MSNVYQEKPNIVTIQITDDTGTAERFVVGKSLDEVISLIEPEAPVAGAKAKKKYKPRRTGPASARNEPAEPAAPSKSAGEEATDRLKKDAATNEPKESVWP